jgi:hypothetical protein
VRTPLDATDDELHGSTRLVAKHDGAFIASLSARASEIAHLATKLHTQLLLAKVAPE